MKKQIITIVITIFTLSLLLINYLWAAELAERLKGRILLQVEEHGQAWYVDPISQTRIFLNRPDHAFAIMKQFGLGVGEDDFIFFGIRAPARLAGRIILRVEAHGEAYYINPVDLRMYYLGRPADAFRIMTDLGLGITNDNLAKIAINPAYQEYVYLEPKVATQPPLPIEPEAEPQPKADQPLAEELVQEYPLHENITATVFWVGEPQGGGSSEDNSLSAWDDEWQKNFGGYDDPYCRKDHYPCSFISKENPFYLSLPYNDFTDNGERKSEAYNLVPWANQKEWAEDESMMKNKWVKITREDKTCYGQVEDTGPYQYDDYNYVFNNFEPINKRANSAGLDVSPALRDCLGFAGLNNADNKVDWQFVDFKNVPAGPWTEIITTSQINWQ